MNDRPMVLISNLSAAQGDSFPQGEAHRHHLESRRHRGHRASPGGGENPHQFNDGKSGYLAQSSATLFRIWARADGASSIEILWPSGKKQTVTTEIPRNALLTVREPAN